MDPGDKLVYAGEPGLQLTWMDAKVGDWVVTPRMGKAVEVNALWHHALCRMAAWAERFGLRRNYSILAKTVAESFNRRFWYAEGGFLFDVIDTQNGADASLRPNQILAVSLDSPLMNNERAAQLLKRVQEKLVTPLGLNPTTLLGYLRSTISCISIFFRRWDR
jgi:predicted glycogen debranching enzyme